MIRTFDISLQAGGSGRVRWRPSGDTHFWSEAQALSNLLKAPETPYKTAEYRSTRPHRSIVCAPNRPQGKPFRFCMDVASSELPTVSSLETVSSRGRKRAGRVLGSESEEGGKTWRMWEIKLLPPVVIDNWLPCAVVVTVRAGGATLAEDTNIAQVRAACGYVAICLFWSKRGQEASVVTLNGSLNKKSSISCGLVWIKSSFFDSTTGRPQVVSENTCSIFSLRTCK
jgi:hypothetical protein